MGKIAKPDVQIICASVPEDVRPYVAELAEDVAFMAGKLGETRIGLEKQQLVIPYDNGGGQAGIRENPAFKAYNALLANYRKSLESLSAILDKHGDRSAMEPSGSPLAQILAEAESVFNEA